MNENKMPCCVVRDLMPSYIEGLTESETTGLVQEHLSDCHSCKTVEHDMRTQVPIKKVPKRALNFLKRIKRIRLLAAFLSAAVTLGCMWWLYDMEYHYSNTEAGRLAAVEDYIPMSESEDSIMPHGVKEGTPMRVVSWKTIENRLFIFYKAENEENVQGIIHLVRGINGKYRTLQADGKPSSYTAGIHGRELTPKGTDWELYVLAGYNCRDIYSVEITYSAVPLSGGDWPQAVKTYEITEPDFLWIMEQENLVKELGFNNEEIMRLYVEEVRMFDKNGNDITEEYKDDSAGDPWSSAKGTEDVIFLLYILLGMVALIGVFFVVACLHRD